MADNSAWWWLFSLDKILRFGHLQIYKQMQIFYTLLCGIWSWQNSSRLSCGPWKIEQSLRNRGTDLLSMAIELAQDTQITEPCIKLIRLGDVTVLIILGRNFWVWIFFMAYFSSLAYLCPAPKELCLYLNDIKFV